MNRIAIIGSNDLGKSILHYARCNEYEIVGFFDDYQKADDVEGVKVIGKLSDIDDRYKNGDFDSLICGIGYNHLKARQEVFQHFHDECHIPFAIIIDKAAEALAFLLRIQ